MLHCVRHFHLNHHKILHRWQPFPIACRRLCIWVLNPLKSHYLSMPCIRYNHQRGKREEHLQLGISLDLVSFQWYSRRKSTAHRYRLGSSDCNDWILWWGVHPLFSRWKLQLNQRYTWRWHLMLSASVWCSIVLLNHCLEALAIAPRCQLRSIRNLVDSHAIVRQKISLFKCYVGNFVSLCFRQKFHFFDLQK